MNQIKNDIFRVSKKTLILIAGLVWLFAGFRVFTLGQGDVINNKGNIFLVITIALVVFLLFFKLVFSKMLQKHTKRIIENELERICAFAFFDKKAYIIMGCMMFFGIVIRSLKIFNPIYLGSFYIGLGGALFLAGVLFVINWFNYEETKVRYNN